jgi:hypothetical protein
MSAAVGERVETGTTGSSRRPSLEVVRDDHGDGELVGSVITTAADPVTTAAGGEGGVIRSCTIGAAIGFTMLTIVITVIGSAAGMATGSALGLGAFVGMFGGAGFGFMMGGTLAIMRVLDADDLARAADHTRRPT